MSETEKLAHVRHSLAHLLAAAVLQFQPNAKNTIGPAIDNGFYYDFEFSEPISDKELPKIEKKMREILKSWDTFSHKEVSEKEAREFFKDNPYKLELIEEIVAKKEKITLYTCGKFTDLCRGGHVENPKKEIPHDSFKLERTAGAYWRGDEKNKMLTRIYGLAFESKEKLAAYEKQIEEAKKRDHKKLGKELELFMFHETSPGMPYWLPNGLVLYNELVNFWRTEHTKWRYHEISSPLVNKAELWQTSGHWEHYKDDMFIADMGENEVYGIKPMNCPNAMVVFQSRQTSYKDLPYRLSDTDRLHRYERSGTLNGLFRVRSFQQDDSHNFISEDMIASEYEHIFAVCKEFYGIFNMTYSFRLGTRPKQFLGEAATWDRAEATLRKILKESGITHTVAEGDGAFYGPKVDILMKDSLGREWQMGTIQLDFQQPIRFELFYTDKDGSRKTPVVIHRVIYGSLERFIGILIEHTAGAFPLWLAPVQVKVIPIEEKHFEAARAAGKALNAAGLRVDLDLSDESFGKKVRHAKQMKMPYFLIIGDKDIAAGKVTLESRDKRNLGQLDVEEITQKLSTEVKEKK
ncbi:MAG: Threonine-tRNA ligase [Candidatus Kaiserbacteria bacterium GW2011_GWA2_49_19]|uniref:Threonine--tRNA ligase n=1 Tax=Candidatus Kaiserbacteria bacterium GW2011_GWA2_49_19 TaxID=1618669 RepID=A0A0G1YSU1_9BACT|nr:MAG: Threonine-tRNA ligase [Candidatus Kaiserbacteria bacterium GW2011_GWA2_49_19]